jgi:hypothetical protein
MKLSQKVILVNLVPAGHVDVGSVSAAAGLLRDLLPYFAARTF